MRHPSHDDDSCYILPPPQSPSEALKPQASPLRSRWFSRLCGHVLCTAPSSRNVDSALGREIGSKMKTVLVKLAPCFLIGPKQPFTKDAAGTCIESRILKHTIPKLELQVQKPQTQRLEPWPSKL